MPSYKVSFQQPVVYLPDHRLHRRVVTELLVNAPDETSARVHAIRVTSGEPGVMTIAPVDLWAIQDEQLKVRRA